MTARGYVSAGEATKLLGIKPATLYAYVSRGLVRRVGASRAAGFAYLREDLDRLALRRRARSGHAAVAADALRWGEPVLDSAITRIEDRGPRYRGRLAVDLVAEGATFEQVAELLWTGTMPEGPAPRFSNTLGASAERMEIARAREVRAALGRVAPLARLIAPLAAEAATEVSRALHPAEDLVRARGLVLALAASAGPRTVKPASSVAATLARAFGVSPSPGAVRAIDTALILLADHELNVSSFAARVAASSGAGLASSLLAGHMALTGARHGGATQHAELFLAKLARERKVSRVVADLVARGESIPGFGHRLYPSGDPRAVPLLELARTLGGRKAESAAATALVRYVGRARGEHPNVDLGLAALACALDAPPGAGAVMFAVGRSVGWVAHALEQRAQGQLLRPRARYVGA